MCRKRCFSYDLRFFGKIFYCKKGGTKTLKRVIFAAILLFAATGIVSICGWVWYNAYSVKKS